MKKTCTECGKAFEAKAPHAKYCCSACGLRHRRREARGAPHPPKPCSECGNTFTPRKVNQKFCSNGCYSSDKRRAYTRNEGADYVPTRGAKREHPKGWEPGVALDGDKGVITTRPSADRDPRWDTLLTEWGFDPAEFEVLEPVQVRTWDAAVGGGEVRQMWYHRANIVRRRGVDARADVEALIKEIRTHKPPKPKKQPDDESVFVLNLADWQLGKSDGDGTEGTVRRVLAMVGEAKERIRRLRATHSLRHLVIAGLGDLHEGCDGHYAMQTFAVDADRRTQVKVTRRLLLKVVTELAPLFETVRVTCVPGNHGENRKDGKAFTTFGDNDDVAVFEQVYDVIKENDGYSHVSFVIPSEDLAVTLEVAGHVVGFAHSHQARGGGAPERKVEEWWKGQQHGMRPIGDATILVTGHYHHLIVKQNGPRTWMQCPALDGGSTWFEETRGLSTPPGTLSFVLTPRGWSDLEVLR